MNRLFLLDCMALLYRAHFALIKKPIFSSRGVNLLFVPRSWLKPRKYSTRVERSIPPIFWYDSRSVLLFTSPGDYLKKLSTMKSATWNPCSCPASSSVR